MARSLGNSAQNIVSGFVSTNATWYEDVELTQNDEQLTDVDGFLWEFEFRKCQGDAADLTLSTSNGRLTVTEGADSTLLQIRVAPGTMAAMCGDYIADLKATDSGTTVDGESRVIHYAHGTITFLGDPAE